MYEKLTKCPNFTLCFSEKYFPGFFLRGGGQTLALYAYGWAPVPGLPPAKSGSDVSQGIVATYVRYGEIST